MKRSVLFVALIVLVLGCKKNEIQEDCSVYYIKDGMKSLVFQKGSYWIYKSDSSQMIDSTYIYSIDYGYLDIGKGHGSIESFEYYMITYASTSPIRYSSYKDYIEMDHMLINPRLWYPYASGPTIYSLQIPVGTFASSENRYHDSLTINGLTFYKVQESRFVLNENSTVFFTTANVGLIKKIIYSDTATYSWGIKRWHIVR